MNVEFNLFPMGVCICIYMNVDQNHVSSAYDQHNPHVIAFRAHTGLFSRLGLGLGGLDCNTARNQSEGTCSHCL